MEVTAGGLRLLLCFFILGEEHVLQFFQSLYDSVRSNFKVFEILELDTKRKQNNREEKYTASKRGKCHKTMAEVP